jgi:ribosomal protein S18 acetylase RimI-like enzyme
MEIQRLEPDQAARLRAIRLRALRDAPDAFASRYEESAARPLDEWRVQLEDLASYVAVASGDDVGLVRAGELREDSRAAILFSLWVAPQARGQGVGDALIETIVAWARNQGFDRLVLDVASDNARAIALYARMGFEPSGETSALPPPRQHILEHRRSRKL